MILKQVIHDTKTNSVEATWVDADGVQVKCHSYAAVQMGMLEADLGAELSKYTSLIATVRTGIVPYVAPPPTIPQSVTMRQARLALLGAGMLPGVTAAINALPSPQKEAAQIEWEYSQTVERNRGFVLILGGALGLTSAQLDSLFVVAAGL